MYKVLNENNIRCIEFDQTVHWRNRQQHLGTGLARLWAYIYMVSMLYSTVLGLDLSDVVASLTSDCNFEQEIS